MEPYRTFAFRFRLGTWIVRKDKTTAAEGRSDGRYGQSTTYAHC